MKPVIVVYTHGYENAKRLLNILFRPAIDEATICTEELWEDGKPLRVERDTEIVEIYKK